MPANWAEIHIKLSGARNAMTGLMGVSGAVTSVGRAEQTQGLFALKASERTWLHNQALFTLRRYAYAGTLALTALIGETLHWGYQFNQTMASSRASLQPVFKDHKALSDELFHLYNFTKHTPFQFKDVTIAFRQLYAGFSTIGIGVDETNKTIKSMVDALSYAGKTSPGALNRVSVALQHMAFLGHITGLQVNQLARDGLPILPTLTKELGLTGEEIHKIGTLGIPTVDVLRALNKYISETPGYMNAAYRQSLTFGGQMTTLKDNISQVVGALMSGPFNKGPGFLNNINKTFDILGNQIQKNYNAGKGMSISWNEVTKIFERRYPWLKAFFMGLDLVFLYAKAAGSVIAHILFPALRSATVALAPLYIFLLLAGRALLFLSHHGQLLRIILTALIVRFIIMKTIMFALWIRATLLNIAWAVYTYRLMITTAWTNRYTAAQLKNLIAMGAISRRMAVQIFMIGRLSAGVKALRALWTVLTVGQLQNSAGQIMALTRMQKFVRSLRYAYIGAGGGIRGFIAALNVARVAMFSFMASIGPLGWILIAIGLLTTLYFTWGRFHDLVNRTLTWMYANWKKIVAVILLIDPPLGLFIGGLILVVKHFKEIVHWAKEAGRWIQNAWNKVPGHGLVPKGGVIPHSVTHNLFHHGLLSLFGGATGGNVMGSGAFMVGERGPEIVTLPAGSSIHPSDGGGILAKRTKGQGIQLPDLYLTTVMKVDGRQLAEITAKHRLDAEARA